MISWDYVARMIEFDARRRDFSLLDTVRAAISDMTWACMEGDKCALCAHYNEEELQRCVNPERCDDDKFIWFGVCDDNVPDATGRETVPFFGTDIEICLADDSILRKILQAALHDMYSHMGCERCCICKHRNATPEHKHICRNCYSDISSFAWRGVCDDNMNIERT